MLRPSECISMREGGREKKCVASSLTTRWLYIPLSAAVAIEMERYPLSKA